MNQNLITVGLVAVGAYFAYKHIKNEVVQGVAMTALSMIAINQIPFVNTAVTTKVLAA